MENQLEANDLQLQYNMDTQAEQMDVVHEQAYKIQKYEDDIKGLQAEL